MQFICFKCGHVTRNGGEKSLRCDDCGRTISRSKYSKLLDRGREIVKFGIKYRLIYEEQVAKKGKLGPLYSIYDPTLIEAFVGIIASGILGNAAYDLLKGILGKLYSEIERLHPKPPSGKPDQLCSSVDLDLLFRLMGDDDDFANQYVGYAQDFAQGKESSNNAVRNAVKGEIDGDRLSRIFRYDPATFVFIGQTGSCFHRQSCNSLHPPKRRIRLKRAALLGRAPCTKCKPLD